MLTHFGKGPRGHGARGGISADSIGTLQAVRGYWEALRRAGGIPRLAPDMRLQCPFLSPSGLAAIRLQRQGQGSPAHKDAAPIERPLTTEAA